VVVQTASYRNSSLALLLLLLLGPLASRRKTLPGVQLTTVQRCGCRLVVDCCVGMMCCGRSSKLWSFYADLEESLGTLESACAVYDTMLDLKVATPQIILNYALMLQVLMV
jgi:hypothetical protein